MIDKKFKLNEFKVFEIKKSYLESVKDESVNNNKPSMSLVSKIEDSENPEINLKKNLFKNFAVPKSKNTRNPDNFASINSINSIQSKKKGNSNKPNAKNSQSLGSLKLYSSIKSSNTSNNNSDTSSSKSNVLQTITDIKSCEMENSEINDESKIECQKNTEIIEVQEILRNETIKEMNIKIDLSFVSFDNQASTRKSIPKVSSTANHNDTTSKILSKLDKSISSINEKEFDKKDKNNFKNEDGNYYTMNSNTEEKLNISYKNTVETVNQEKSNYELLSLGTLEDIECNPQTPKKRIVNENSKSLASIDFRENFSPVAERDLKPNKNINNKVENILFNQTIQDLFIDQSHIKTNNPLEKKRNKHDLSSNSLNTVKFNNKLEKIENSQTKINSSIQDKIFISFEIGNLFFYNSSYSSLIENDKNSPPSVIIRLINPPEDFKSFINGDYYSYYRLKNPLKSPIFSIPFKKKKQKLLTEMNKQPLHFEPLPIKNSTKKFQFEIDFILFYQEKYMFEVSIVLPTKNEIIVLATELLVFSFNNSNNVFTPSSNQVKHLISFKSNNLNKQIASISCNLYFNFVSSTLGFKSQVNYLYEYLLFYGLLENSQTKINNIELNLTKCKSEILKVVIEELNREVEIKEVIISLRTLFSKITTNDLVNNWKLIFELSYLLLEKANHLNWIYLSDIFNLIGKVAFNKNFSIINNTNSTDKDCDYFYSFIIKISTKIKLIIEQSVFSKSENTIKLLLSFLIKIIEYSTDNSNLNKFSKYILNIYSVIYEEIILTLAKYIIDKQDSNYLIVHYFLDLLIRLFYPNNEIIKQKLKNFLKNSLFSNTRFCEFLINSHYNYYYFEPLISNASEILTFSSFEYKNYENCITELVLQILDLVSIQVNNKTSVALNKNLFNLTRHLLIKNSESKYTLISLNDYFTIIKIFTKYLKFLELKTSSYQNFNGIITKQDFKVELKSDETKLSSEVLLDLLGKSNNILQIIINFNEEIADVLLLKIYEDFNIVTSLIEMIFCLKEKKVFNIFDCIKEKIIEIESDINTKENKKLLKYKEIGISLIQALFQITNSIFFLISKFEFFYEVVIKKSITNKIKDKITNSGAKSVKSSKSITLLNDGDSTLCTSVISNTLTTIKEQFPNYGKYINEIEMIYRNIFIKRYDFVLDAKVCEKLYLIIKHLNDYKDTFEYFLEKDSKKQLKTQEIYATFKSNVENNLKLLVRIISCKRSSIIN